MSYSGMCSLLCMFQCCFAPLDTRPFSLSTGKCPVLCTRWKQLFGSDTVLGQPIYHTCSCQTKCKSVMRESKHTDLICVDFWHFLREGYSRLKYTEVEKFVHARSLRSTLSDATSRQTVAPYFSDSPYQHI